MDAFERLEKAQEAAAALQAAAPSADAGDDSWLDDGQTPAVTEVPVLTGAVVKDSPTAEIPNEPDFVVATDETPEAQFAHYDATISRARAKVERVLSKAERYWRLTAGPALKEIRDSALYKTAGFASFERYVEERWDMSRQRAYQLIDSVRGMKALEPVTGEVPNERQLRVIVRIVDDHGEEAAQQVWKRAEERGRTSGAALEQAAIDLGFRPALDPPKPSIPEPAWPRLRAAVREVFDLRLMRERVQTDPDGARQFVAELEQVLAEVKADLAAFPPNLPDNES